MAEQLNIYQKLAKIRKQVEILKKDAKAYGYNYTKEETILAKISVFMDKYGLSLIPGIVPGTTKVEPYHYMKTRTTKTGDIYEEHVNDVLVSADTMYTWVDNDDPSKTVIVPWTMVGQQSDASQAFGSGLTYSNRYFLLKYFNVATSDDDPDKFRSKQKEAEAAADKAVTDEIVRQIDETIKSYLASHADKGADVKAVVTRYVKDGNYFKIKESALAAKLLKDVAQMCDDSKEEQ